jgi:hypothetical protein
MVTSATVASLSGCKSSVATAATLASATRFQVRNGVPIKAVLAPRPGDIQDDLQAALDGFNAVIRYVVIFILVVITLLLFILLTFMFIAFRPQAPIVLPMV